MNQEPLEEWIKLSHEEARRILKSNDELIQCLKNSLTEKEDQLLNLSIETQEIGYDFIPKDDNIFASSKSFQVIKNRLNEKLIDAYAKDNISVLIQLLGEGKDGKLRKSKEKYKKYYLGKKKGYKEEIKKGQEDDEDSEKETERYGENTQTTSSLQAERFSGLFRVPHLPSWDIVGREDDLHNLKMQLGVIAGSKKPKSLKVLTAMRGLPGVGKTTTTIALAYEPEIPKAFPDGVLWISLGQNPDLLSKLLTWGRYLGSKEILSALTLEDVISVLTDLLRNKCMLLVVDDVWGVEHVVPFQQACGRECTLLIATRETAIAEALARTSNDIYILDVLTEENALKLLRTLVQGIVDKYPDESLELVREVEYLPLALQVAGRLLRTEYPMGWGIGELLTELREGVKILEAKAPPDLMELRTQTIPTVSILLQKSTDRLDKQTKYYFAYLGGFAPKPATFALEDMKEIWEVTNPQPIVRQLVNRGLLEPLGHGRFQMHSLLVKHARSLCSQE